MCYQYFVDDLLAYILGHGRDLIEFLKTVSVKNSIYSEVKHEAIDLVNKD